MSEVIWKAQTDNYRIKAFEWDCSRVGIEIWGGGQGNAISFDRAAARALASALLQWAGSDDPEWGPLIPWFGHGCPLDQWEFDNARIVLAAREDGHLFSTRVATSEEWRHAEENPSHVIAYRVRKRPTAPVEEWVRRTVVLGEQSAKVEILMRDGKAVDARMAQEGE